MLSRFRKSGLGVTLLLGAAAPAGAASITPMIHPPAQFRIDFPRQGVLPGAPRDIAAARDFGSDETVGLGQNGDELTGPGTVRHKRRPRVH